MHTRFATNVLNLSVSLFIYLRIAVLPVQKVTFWVLSLISFLINLSIFTATMAAVSSILVVVICFRGATPACSSINAQGISLCLFTSWRYETVPHPLSPASEKWLGFYNCAKVRRFNAFAYREGRKLIKIFHPHIPLLGKRYLVWFSSQLIFFLLSCFMSFFAQSMNGAWKPTRS